MTAVEGIMFSNKNKTGRETLKLACPGIVQGMGKGGEVGEREVTLHVLSLKMELDIFKPLQCHS